MDLSVIVFLGLLALVGLSRLAELGISRRHQRAMARRGIAKRRDPQFSGMVLLHAGVLAGAALEVVLLRRPFIPALAVVMGIIFAMATALRWWVIGILGIHWNVEVMASAPLGVVSTGPYRWVRHPNYLAVFAELAALPLIHTAWITALVAASGNAWALRHRLRVEEPILAANPSYQAVMAGKPRFLPKLF